ncbi:HGxxPAAW family protein [Xylanimonas sp. McL0601]|uniref:HGxxPAAW family protein n=1 Tax=Xylanimonas sp. McL0601 TaxID=3414739 RepID=UPI003CF5E64C
MAENSNADNVYLPDAAPFHNEGKTVAAWVAMTGVTLGAIIAAIGFLAPTMWVIVVGAVVVVGSLVAGAVLRSLGHGQPRSSVREPRA